MTTYSTVKAAALDITIKRGDTQSITIPLSDPDDSDNPVDLSGYNAIRMQIKTNASSAALLDLTLGSGISLGGVDNNELTIDLTYLESAIGASTYKYDIEGTITATSFVRTLVEGDFIVKQDITNS